MNRRTQLRRSDRCFHSADPSYTLKVPKEDCLSQCCPWICLFWICAIHDNHWGRHVVPLSHLTSSWAALLGPSPSPLQTKSSGAQAWPRAWLHQRLDKLQHLIFIGNDWLGKDGLQHSPEFDLIDKLREVQICAAKSTIDYNGLQTSLHARF